MKTPIYYPIFLDLRGKRSVVIGGGKVAERKVLGLLEAGASVVVVSPELTKRLKREKEKGRITHIPSRYKRQYLKGASLIIAATDCTEENKKISLDAGTIPVNVVDTPELCSFIVPSIVRRGPLTIAISTSGSSPALAKEIRLELERLYPESFGRFLKDIMAKRKKIIKEIKDKKQMERALKALVPKGIISSIRGR